jgi:hypothetical protein
MVFNHREAVAIEFLLIPFITKRIKCWTLRTPEYRHVINLSDKGKHSVFLQKTVEIK